MKLLGVISRKALIDFYLGIEAIKKNKPIPPSYGSLNPNNTNAIDTWLENNGYKRGVIGGFKSWAFVELATSDLGDIAVVDGIFKSGKILKPLSGTQEFRDWIPNRNPLPIWYAPLWIDEWRDDFSIILRAPTPTEKSKGAKLYVEDGSGRTICYYRSLLRTNSSSKMRGYVGFDPDPQSTFFKEKLEKEFAINSAKYATFDELVKTTGITLSS